MPDPLDTLNTALADRYRIESELGAGGMATVYRARDLRHDRDVAIKVLLPELSVAVGGERFLAEIRTTARLQHPHILPLLDSGHADALLFYVMPLVEGESLRARLERSRPLPIDEALRLAREVARALDFAHRQGVVHRDIKPENILLQDGQALVADFGIALAIASAGTSRLTGTGLSLGTPHYMAPEQAMGERTLDARADIYALGAVTYEMLAGEPPFTGPNTQSIVAKLLTERPTSLRTVRDTVPVNVDAAVLRALAKLPADRPQSAAEFADALVATAPEGAMPATATRTRPASANANIASTWAAPRRSAAVQAAAGILLIGLAAVAGWFAARRAPSGGASQDDRVTVTSIVPPSGYTLAERNAIALRPDGRAIVQVLIAGDGSRGLWRRALDRDELVPITGTAGAEAPFWSSDGRRIGYFARGALWVINERGEQTSLCPVAGPLSGSWSPFDTIAFAHRGGVSTVSARGGACRVIVSADSAPDAMVSFLADGARLMLSPISGRGTPIRVVNLTGHVLRQLPDSEAAASVVGDLLVTFNSTNRSVEARRFDASSLEIIGPKIRLVSDVRNSSGLPTLSVAASGDLVYLGGTIDRPYLEYDARGLLLDTVRIEGTWTISARSRAVGPPLVALAGRLAGVWLYELDADRPTRLPLADSLWGISPVLSRDGRTIAYGVRGRQSCGIAVRDLASGSERLIGMRVIRTQLPCDWPLSWTPDARALLVRRDTALAIVRVEDGAVTRTLFRPGRVYEASIDPTGARLALSSDETGRPEVYVMPLAGGTATRVTTTGGRWPQWGSTGRTLYFLTSGGRANEVHFGADGGAPGAERVLFAPPTWRRSIFNDNGTGFAVVGDGERFVVRQSPSAPHATFVQGWRALMTATAGR